MLLRDIVNRNARMYPRKVATIWGEIKHTFLEFQQRVNRIANALLDLDLVKGDRVAVLLRNCSPYLELHFGLPQAGIITVPLNYRNRKKELIYAIQNSGANTLVFGKEFAEVINSIRGDLRGVKNFISVGGRISGFHEYEELMFRSTPEEPRVDLDEEDVVALVYTSGTTGRPKGAMITHKSILTDSKNIHASVPHLPQDVGLNFFPLFHIGFSRSICYMGVGATNLFADFSPQVACKLIEEERVTQIAITPAQVNLLINFPEVNRYDLSSLRNVISGGGHTSLTTLENFFHLMPDGFNIYCIIFGQTEASACITANLIRRDMLNGLGDKMKAFKKQKAGAVPVGEALPYCQVRIVDEEDRDVPPWEPGEVLCYGENVMKGYWRQPEATEETLRNGWLHTGDIGLFADDGDIYIVDRKKDMILSGDENIYPAEVEEVLYSHPSILEAAVIGVPHEKWGETVKAFVVLKKEASATAEEIMEYCKGRLSSYKKPTSVDFVDQLPRNPSGKVLKTELRRPYWSEKKK